MTRTLSEALDAVLTHIHSHWWPTFVLHTTNLRGPPSESMVYGVGNRVLDIDDMGAVYEAWAQEYGPVYTIPSALGEKKIILCDPKSVTHFYSKEMRTYIQTPFSKKALEMVFGRGLLWAHGEDHKRQRKSLAPAFSIAAIRQSTSIFYDSAYKAKGAWDALIESSGGDSTIIDVESWMNRITLDTIGLAAFSHDFGALGGKHTNVTEIFDTFSASPHSSALNTGLFLWAQIFPSLVHVPTPRGNLIRKLSAAMAEISKELLTRTRKELDMGKIGSKEEMSVIEWLIKGARNDSEFRLTEEEVMAQMKFLLLAGYETTSVTLSWTLVELSCNPDVQKRLRNELLEHSADLTYDQLSNSLPYLDAIIHETLRVHTPLVETTRIAIEDGIIPLSELIRIKSGELVDSITIAKGTQIMIPMESINRSAAIWGEDAKVFRPSRWLKDAQGESGIPAKAKEIRGHRHLLSFSDGSKICLGRNFAVTVLKTVLAVLVKNYVFELPDGVDTRIEIGTGIILRPKIAGEVGCKLPLHVRPYVA